jgi:DNA repair protein RadC
MITKSESLNIKSWAPEDRPREKLIMKGKSALSEAELLAILLGSGTKKMSAVEIGKRLFFARRQQSSPACCFKHKTINER